MTFLRCSRCVMPSSRPDVPFVDGVCQACINHDRRFQIDWQQRHEELVKLLERHDGKVIVPSSGGKDSTYIAMTLKGMGADVTAVTATTCHLTPIGRANIDNLAKHVRTIEVTPNKTVRAKLIKLGMELVGDASWGQHASIWAIPFRMAAATKTPLLMWGENSQDQYGGPRGTEEARQMTRRWCSEFGGLNGLRAADFVGVEGIEERDMYDYQLPSYTELEAAGVEGHFLGSYIKWDSRQNAEFSKLHGMQTEHPCDANWFNFENLDCFVTAWHDAQMYRKYGFGRGCVQLSIDIRDGQVTREGAYSWLKEHDGILSVEYAGVHENEVLCRIGMERPQLIQQMGKFTDWSLFDREEDGRPILKEFA